MRRLLLHIQGENKSVADYVHHFRGLWSTAEAFGALSGLHMGQLQSWIKKADWVIDPDNQTDTENERAKRE